MVSNGSFAKIIAPGLRLGWYEAPQRVIDLLQGSYLIESGGGQTAYLSHVVAEALKNGVIDQYVQSLRVAHKVKKKKCVFLYTDLTLFFTATLSLREVWGSIPGPVKSAQCRHRCYVFSELCCPGAKPRRWALPLEHGQLTAKKSSVRCIVAKMRFVR